MVVYDIIANSYVAFFTFTLEFFCSANNKHKNLYYLSLEAKKKKLLSYIVKAILH